MFPRDIINYAHVLVLIVSIHKFITVNISLPFNHYYSLITMYRINHLDKELKQNFVTYKKLFINDQKELPQYRYTVYLLWDTTGTRHHCISLEYSYLNI